MNRHRITSPLNFLTHALKISLAVCRFLAMAGLILATTVSRSQTAYPMLMSTFPSGAQRGKTTVVTINVGTSNGGGGTNLYGAYKAIVEGAGVSAEIVPPDKGWAPLDPKKPFILPIVNSVSMKLTVAPDAPLGTREYRIATPYQGSSTIGQIVIGDEPEIAESEPNNDLEHAQSIPIPCVLNGKYQQGEDVDCYKFKVEAGQSVTFEIKCARLQDKVHDIAPHADPLLILMDSTGRELGRNDDYYRADPLLHYQFAKAGEYFIQTRDVNYQGNPHWVYRLNVTSRPFVTSLNPCAFQPGLGQTVAIEGFNLKNEQFAKIDIPASARAGVWETSLKTASGATNVVQVYVSDMVQTSQPGSAKGGNRTITAAATNATPKVEKGELRLPGGVSSLIGLAGEIDKFSFKAKKGEAWSFETIARRIDSELDSEIKIRDAKGSVLASNDDAIGKDSRIDWTAPETGEYSIEIRDLTGHGGVWILL